MLRRFARIGGIASASAAAVAALLSTAAAAAAAAAPGAAVAWRAASAGGAALEVYADDSYALLAPGGAPWLASGPTAVHVRDTWFASAAPPPTTTTNSAPLLLTRLGAGPSADGSGGYEIRYSANGSTPVTVSFALNASTGAFVFTQRFPLGASGVATQTPTNASAGAAGALGEFASSTTPATQFPAFAQAAGSPSAASLGFVSWAGRFFQSTGQPGGGAGAALAAGAAGAEGGPILLYEGDGRGRAAVLSPYDNFKSTMLGKLQSGGAGAAAGVSGYVASLPANFSTSTVVIFGGAGITDAMHTWGAALLARHGGGAKVDDPTSSQLTYWTDSE